MQEAAVNWRLKNKIQSRGRRPTPQNLGLAAQTGPKGALTRAPSGHPRFLTARYRSLAIFQRLRKMPQNPAAARFLPVGLQTARKNTRFSTSPFSVIFESGQRLFSSQPRHDIHNFEKQRSLKIDSFKVEMARSEILLTEGSRPQGSKPSRKEPRSGNISRHTQEEQNMSVVPAVARVGKKRGRSKREALSSLFGGFGAAR
ncbi:MULTISPECIES: hypothetical protein [Rahnella]|uniref:Uncharacterized protein n=1 Tax=Rahnella laticis TaxID=2787622 RepID=A0ABS0DZ40_9GAMM|nr:MULTISPECIES: hypothetical protein [Rahnella]MBF7978061.1 hypothetical protein [Rahnella laticis]MBF7998222.1 hypothetical protein [Rahnella sp. LAC-M12]